MGKSNDDDIVVVVDVDVVVVVVVVVLLLSLTLTHETGHSVPKAFQLSAGANLAKSVYHPENANKDCRLSARKEEGGGGDEGRMWK